MYMQQPQQKGLLSDNAGHSHGCPHALAKHFSSKRETREVFYVPFKFTTFAGDGEDDGVCLQFTASLRSMQRKALRAIGN